MHDHTDEDHLPAYPIMGWAFIVLAAIVAAPAVAVILWAVNR